MAIVRKARHVQTRRATEAIVELTLEVVRRERLHGLVAEDRLVLWAWFK